MHKSLIEGLLETNRQKSHERDDYPDAQGPYQPAGAYKEA
jgi:hypothetical protein